MQVLALLRPPPDRRDLERGLLAELARHAQAGGGQLPNAWTVLLSPRDRRRRARELSTWAALLPHQLIEEYRRLGRAPAGLVTLAFDVDRALRPGTFRVSGQVRPGRAEGTQLPRMLPGNPRLVLPTGGSVPMGSPGAAGLEQEVVLRPGQFVIGRDASADLRLPDPTLSPRHVLLDISPDGQQVRVHELGSRNGTAVDGVPVLARDLVDGNRLTVGHTTVVFRRDPLSDGAGRQGGEG